MLKSAKLEEFSPAKIKELRSILRKVLSSQRQKGSILISMIITMVIMASLGAGMLYLTTTSTFGELFTNNHQRAYYIASSGGRYVTALIRQSLATGSPSPGTLSSTIPGTYSFNGDQFQITNWFQSSGNPVTIQFSSIGTVNSGFLLAKKQISYSIQAADQSGGGTTSSPPTTPNINLQTLAASPNVVGSFTYKTTLDGGQAALYEQGAMGGGNSVEAYLSFTSNMASPFYNAWVNAGHFSSYDAQVKVATGSVDSNGLFTTNLGTQYGIGLTLRYKMVGGSGNQDTFLGVSFTKTINGKGDGISDNMIPTPVSTYNDKPMIMLWSRGGNQAGGDDSWLAFKTLTTSNYVIKDYNGDNTCPFGTNIYCIKKWSTIAARIIEAASIKLLAVSAPEIVAGTTIITDSNGNTALVIKKIKDNDGNEVLLLNNVTTGFSMPATVGNARATSAWRAKDEYIWVFYGDTSDEPNGTSGNTIPIDEIRLKNIREGTLNWPVQDITVDNGNPWTNQWSPAYDHFTLVRWEEGIANPCLLYTSTSCTRVMGSNLTTEYEYNSIIRLDDVHYVTQASYSASTNPELGLVALGSDLVGKGYYDDFAYYIISRGGGTIGTGTVIQSP